MPKSNLVRDPTKERAEIFAGNIDKYIRIRGNSNKEVAKAIGVSERVLYNRRESPKAFSLPEMLLIMDYLQFSPADRAEVVGVQIKICELN